MKTNDLVNSLASRGTQYHVAPHEQHKEIIDSAKVTVDSFILEKQLGPLATKAKIDRIGAKAIAAMVGGGLSIPQAHHFAAAVGLCNLGTCGSSLPTMQTAGARCVVASPSVGATEQAASDALEQALFVSFRAMDLTAVRIPRAAIEASDAVLLKHMLSGDYADRPDASGHYALPALRRRELDLLSAFLTGNDDAAQLTEQQLVDLHKAADFVGSDSLMDIVNHENHRRLVDTLFTDTALDKIAIGLGEKTKIEVSHIANEFLQRLDQWPVPSRIAFCLPALEVPRFSRDAANTLLNAWSGPYAFDASTLTSHRGTDIKGDFGSALPALLAAYSRLALYLQNNGFTDVHVHLDAWDVDPSHENGFSLMGLGRAQHVVVATPPVVSVSALA